MNRQLRIAAALTATLLMAGCGSGHVVPSPPSPVVAQGVAMREPMASPRPYGAADTAFGLAALSAWCRADPQANLVLSPSSLASGLGMAYLGARGGTAQAMASVLHLPVTREPSLEAGLQARSAALRGLDSPGVTLQASDQVWTDPTLTTLRSYLNAVATSYDAGVARVPLLHRPDDAAQQINAAIAAATRGQIPQLLDPGSLTGVGWVLTDALYLKAAWATPFQASLTNSDPFTTAAGHQVSAEFMDGDGYRAATGAGWTAVSLPYRGGKLAMTALLPRANTSTSTSACTMPSAPALRTITASLTAQSPTAAIAIPRVHLGTKVDMKALLSGLGMGVAFSGSADFAGLSPQAASIGLVEQAATLQVGEQGTVASAATAVGMEASAVEAPRNPIVFNRPYLLMVTDIATGEPLFLARVTDPAAR